MGKHDSSLTRVVPVFRELIERDEAGETWLPQLLELPRFGHADAHVVRPKPPLKDWAWGDRKEAKEKALAPPVSLLSWLVRNIGSTGASPPQGDCETARKRRLLFDGDPNTVAEALSHLRPGSAPKKWYVFEGRTQPDLYLETDDTVVVVEGKRTEPALTTCTTWMPERDQMLRHIDAAWEVRGRRRVYGFFIVEGGNAAEDVDVPEKWRKAAAESVSPATLGGSLPHRGPDEQLAIARCFLGATTWQAVCAVLDVSWDDLPDTVQ